MNIAMTGGTGFLGQHLTGVLTRQGHHVYILSRNARETEQKNMTYVQWLTEGAAPEQELPHIDVWINLAGKSIFGRWTKKTKQHILSSRINATREVQRLIQKQKEKPKTLIQASAVGIYGTSLEKTFTEDSATSDEDFSAILHTCGKRKDSILRRWAFGQFMRDLA